MQSYLRSGLMVAAAFSVLALLATPRGQAQSADEIIKRATEYLASKDPEKRATGAEAIAAANTKKASELICKALLAEKDNDAAIRIGAAFSKLNSEESLAELTSTIPNWTRPEQIFAAYYALTGIARGRTAGGDALVKACVLGSKDKDFNLKAAGLEAIGEAGRKELAPLLAELLKTWNKDWDEKGAIVGLCAVFAAPKIVHVTESAKDVRDSVMRGLINVLVNAKNDRLVYFAVKALADITGEKMYSEPKFWEWWISVGGYKAAPDRPDGATTAERKTPRFFDMATVGKRIVFCIDVSGSMAGEVAMPPAPKKEPAPEKKKDGPVTGEKGKKVGGEKGEEPKSEPDPPDYSKVKIKLDLAKVELIYALRQLDSEFLFNVAIYDTGHSLLMPSTKNLVPATEENKNRFIKAVEKLAPLQLTNIHGGLMDSFSLTERGFLDWKKIDPAWQEDCIQFGAETIFFLTDGSPTISDDTTNSGDVGRTPQVPVGNGKMCKPENIIAEVKRVNTFRKAVIHTVGIGPHDGRLMNELARISGGTYTDRTGVAKR